MNIRISQAILKSSYPWLETVMLVSDREAERLNDWVVGYYHCTYCDTWQGFAFQLPPKGSTGISARAHNDRNAFWRKHAHGDGRILLFEKDIPETENEK